MAQLDSSTQRWNRTEGYSFSVRDQAHDVESVLRELSVVARLEWYPHQQHQLGLVVLTDVDGRVAVTPPSRGGVVAGMGLSELVEELATRLEAHVVIGPAGFDALPASAELPEPRDREDLDVGTVVVSPLSAYTVPLQATLLERPLVVASLPELDRRVVMYEGEGLDLGVFGWDDDMLPALVLHADGEEMSVSAVVSHDEDETVRFSWAMVSRYVWGGVEEPGPALRNLVDELLADTADAQALAATVPGADAEAVKAALETEGEEGMRAMVRALGLPEWIEEFLTGHMPPTEAPGAVLHEPRGLSNAVTRSVGLMLNDMTVPGAPLWHSYVRVVTDMPWLPRLVAVAEAGVGGALIGGALRRRRRGGAMPVGTTLAGLMLVADAVAEASLASWIRHRELRRRADEETALVAEELGA